MKKEPPKNLSPTENGINYPNQMGHVSLEFTEKDLKNPGVAKRILADNQSLKREVSTLKESLKVSQNTFEKLRNKHHEIDKENAVLKERTSLLSRFEIIKSLSLIGVGSAITLLLNKNYIFAAIIGVLSLIILVITVLPKEPKLK
jgi:hypothetical protein